MHFDSTVTLGNVFTMVTLAGTALIIGLRMDMKVKYHDKWILDHAECNRKQIEILAEVRTDLAYLRGRADQKKEDGLQLKDRY